MRTVVALLLLLAFGTATASSEICRSISDDLRRMVAIDQHVREMVQAAELGTGPTRKAEIERSIQRAITVDRTHEPMLVRILTNCGWPRMSVHGEATTGATWILVMHIRPELQRQFLPLLEARVAEGEAPPSDFAFLTDRVRIHNGLKQLYGTQASGNSPCEFKLLPIEDEENVEQRRSKMKMPPLSLHTQAVREFLASQGCPNTP